MSAERLYSAETNLWIELATDGMLSVGVARRSSVLFGVPEYVSLPAVGEEIVPNVLFGSLENSKMVLDLALPFAAVVTGLETDPTPEALKAVLDAGQALVRIRPSSDDWREGLLDEAGYRAFVEP